MIRGILSRVLVARAHYFSEDGELIQVFYNKAPDPEILPSHLVKWKRKFNWWKLQEESWPVSYNLCEVKYHQVLEGADENYLISWDVCPVPNPQCRGSDNPKPNITFNELESFLGRHANERISIQHAWNVTHEGMEENLGLQSFDVGDKEHYPNPSSILLI